MTTYLLAIGINHYTDRAFRTLSCCENDATELHSLFKRNLELGDRAHKLIGAVSIADVKTALRRIGQEIRNGDTFVFFFAGHGYQHPRKEDQYLMFPDAEAVLVNKGHRDGMLALSALRDLTEHWIGVARVFILDACRSWLPGRGVEGTRFDNEAALADLASRSPGYAGPKTPGDSTASPGGALPPVILNATRNGQEAKELENQQRGVLALALEQSLESQQQTGQVIYLGERLLGDISQRMNELLQHGRLGVEQTPFLTPSSAQVLLFKPARSAEPAHDDDETEWAIACAKGTLDAYEAYARRKPSGKHHAEALINIGKKSTSSQPIPSSIPAHSELPLPLKASPHPECSSISTQAPNLKLIGRSPWLVFGALGVILAIPGIILGVISSPSPPYAPLAVFRDSLKNGGQGPAMVVIPAGEFDMGSNDGEPNEKPEHRVSIGHSFALGRTEVTQKEWRQVMGSDPTSLEFKGCDDCPVENVSWKDAQSYIKKLNELTGKTTYRLPSEAEWEFACRSGNATEKYCGGNDVGGVAWYRDNSSNSTHPVAQKKANDYGLYDMSGNVLEWVEDRYQDSYTRPPLDGSAWVSDGEQAFRVLRGGAWGTAPRNVGSTGRFAQEQGDRYDHIGFRVARTLP